MYILIKNSYSSLQYLARIILMDGITKYSSTTEVSRCGEFIPDFDNMNRDKILSNVSITAG